jgi:hypothetical protein
MPRKTKIVKKIAKKKGIPFTDVKILKSDKKFIEDWLSFKGLKKR